MNPDYYKILQVDPHADPEVVKAAYKSLSKRYHPDTSGSDGQMMKLINEAYEVLSDAQKRAHYDSVLGYDQSEPAEEYLPAVRFGLKSGSIFSVAVSPEGKWLAVGSDDGVSVYEHYRRTIKLLWQAPITSGVTSLAISTDGMLVAAGSRDRMVRVWHSAGGKAYTNAQYASVIYSIAFLPDSQELVSGSRDWVLRRWNYDGQLLHEYCDHSSSIYSVATSRDILACGGGGPSERCDITLWDLSTNTPIYALKGHNDVISTLKFSSSGKMLWSGSYDGTIRLWSVGSGQLASIWEIDNAVSSIAVSPNDKAFVSGTLDGNIQIWQRKEREPQGYFQGHTDKVTSLAFVPNSTFLISGSHDGSIILWDAGSLQR